MSACSIRICFTGNPVFMYSNYKIAHNLEIHSAYTRLREVECVYDALLTRFDRDPDLKPSDCIVMVPNINSYVPFIRAVFEPLLDQNTAGERRKFRSDLRVGKSFS